MRFPFVTRRRYVRDLAHQERGWQRFTEQADNNHRAELAALNEKFTDVSIVNNRLTEDLVTAAARIAEYGIRRTVPEVLEEHDVHRKALADALGSQKYHLNWGQLTAEVARLRESAVAWMADHAVEKQRADHLQERLDQALGLDDAAVVLGASWQDRRQKHMQFDKPATAGEAS
jgi:hypothetical protein